MFAIVFVTDESIYLLYPHARSSRHKIKIAVIAGHGIETASFLTVETDLQLPSQTLKIKDLCCAFI